MSSANGPSSSRIRATSNFAPCRMRIRSTSLHRQASNEAKAPALSFKKLLKLLGRLKNCAETHETCETIAVAQSSRRRLSVPVIALRPYRWKVGQTARPTAPRSAPSILPTSSDQVTLQPPSSWRRAVFRWRVPRPSWVKSTNAIRAKRGLRSQCQLTARPVDWRPNHTD